MRWLATIAKLYVDRSILSGLPIDGTISHKCAGIGKLIIGSHSNGSNRFKIAQKRTSISVFFSNGDKLDKIQLLSKFKKVYAGC